MSPAGGARGAGVILSEDLGSMSLETSNLGALAGYSKIGVCFLVLILTKYGGKEFIVLVTII